MKSIEEIIEMRVGRCDLLSKAGVNDDLRSTWRFVASTSDAIAGMVSPAWIDMKTEAQGNLTGYLAKHHYHSYGGVWNKVANQSKGLVRSHFSDLLTTQLHKLGAEDLVSHILLDLSRATLEIFFRSQFKKAPVFFEGLLEVYEAGHLPCGIEVSADERKSNILLIH